MPPVDLYREIPVSVFLLPPDQDGVPLLFDPKSRVRSLVLELRASGWFSSSFPVTGPSSALFPDQSRS